MTALSRVHKLWALRLPRRLPGESSKLIELLLLSLSVPIAGILLSPQDPMGLTAAFPWLLFPSVLFAARYGLVWGLSCVSLTLLNCLFPWYAGSGYSIVFSEHLHVYAGLFITTLVVGEFTDVWRKRFLRAQAEKKYVRHRLESFSRDYQLLKVSHGLLEQFVAGQRVSLRQTMQQLRLELENQDQPDLAKAGMDMMAIFSHFGSIQIAGLYLLRQDGKTLVRKPAATFGEMIELPLFDPLLREALKRKQLVSVRQEARISRQQNSELLAVVPLVDSQGTLHGVIAIREMHFMAFEQKKLNLLALLGGYIGDILTRARLITLGQSERTRFMMEVCNALRFANDFNTESWLVTFLLSGPKQTAEIAEWLRSNNRGLDSSYSHNCGDGQYLVSILMPLTTGLKADAYLDRIKLEMETRWKLPIENVVQAIQQKTIRYGATFEECNALVSGENIETFTEKVS